MSETVAPPGTVHLHVGHFGFPDPVSGLETVRDGDTAPPVPGAEVPNAFWLEPSPVADLLYAVTNTPAAQVYALATGPDGALVERARVATGGDGAVHVAMHPDGRFLLVCHHDSASVAVVPLDGDGLPVEPVTLVEHTGTGGVPEVQAAPHPHMASFDPSGQRVLIADKGTDRLHAYRVDGGRLVADGGLALAPGSGPRHLVRHPDGRTVYVVGELDSTVTVCRDGGTGPEVVGTRSTRVDGAEGWNAPSGIVLGPRADRLYVANRGDDTLATFAIDDDGLLGPATTTSVREEDGAISLPWDLALHGDVLHVVNHLTRTLQHWDVGGDGAPVLLGSRTLAGPVVTVLAR